MEWLGLMPQYGTSFSRFLNESSVRSAQVVAPLVLDLIEVKSVIDVGCGTGAWLAAFAKLGLSEIQGVDGVWTDPQALLIPSDCFRRHDLRQPIEDQRRYDLALCLEVAEHLPASRSETLVGELVGLAPAVLFSAAIPLQTGRGHVNCQWQSYWEALFRSHDYAAVDFLRWRVWNNQDVSTWFRQNMVLYVDNRMLADGGRLAAERRRASEFPRDLVHPDMLMALASPRSQTVRRAAKNLLHASWNAVRRRLLRRARGSLGGA